MNIIGNKITLRAIELEDLDQLHVWANDPNTQDIIGNIHFPSSREYQSQWFNNLQTDVLNQRLAITTKEDGLIGISSIMNIDWRNRHAWHGIVLGDKNIRGKGYGVDTVMTTMRYAFEEMNLERLDGSIIEYNTISYSMYCSKLGWKEEGRKKNYYFRKGKYYEQIIVGITKNEYYELIKQNNYWNEKL
jgi:RimJ/RimL family protein N-acetyltransferase